MDDGKETIMIFCNNVKFLRKQNNISKKYMAKIMGIGVGSLSKVENGCLPKRLNVSAALNIADYFKIKPHEPFEEIK